MKLPLDITTTMFLKEAKVYVKRSPSLPYSSGNYELVDIWKSYFNASWFAGISPFKVIHADDRAELKHQFKRKSTTFQSVICAVVYFLVILFSLNNNMRNLQEALDKFAHDKSRFLFILAKEIFHLGMPLLSFRELWWCQEKVIHIMNLLVSPSTGIPRVSGKVILRAKIFMVTGFLVQCMGQFIVEQYLLYKSVGSDGYWYSLCELGSPSVLFSKDSCVASEDSSLALSFRGQLVANLALCAKCLW